MMRSFRKAFCTTVILGLSGLSLLGCLGGGGGGEADPGGSSGVNGSDSNAIAGNNRALISGAVIGDGTEAVSNLRKQIAVNVIGKNDLFSIGTAFATRSSSTGVGSGYTYIVLPVTNIGKQARCLVQFTGLTYRDASGTALTTFNPYKAIFVTGSVGKLSSGGFSTTCIASGETGFAIEVIPGPYTAVAKMEFTVTSSGAGGAPSARVIPQSYTPNSTTGALAISVANVGAVPATLTTQQKWFLLDDAEQPLLFGFASPAVSRIPVTGSVSVSTYVAYNGLASKLLFVTDFMDAPEAAALKETDGVVPSSFEVCADSLPVDELTSCRLISRNRQLLILKAFDDIHQAAPEQTQ